MTRKEDITMKTAHLLGPVLLGTALAVAGCGGASDRSETAAQQAGTEGDQAKVKANLAKLSPEDRKLAEAQKLCPVSGEPLGEMGPPVKIEVEGQPVFLCCDDCEKKARSDPARTLRKVQEYRAKTGAR
jgi:hypothetical protein